MVPGSFSSSLLVSAASSSEAVARTVVPGGTRAVEHLRLVMAEVQVATVRNQVALSLFTDFENYTTFKPAAHHEKSVNSMLDQLIAWSGAMKGLREKSA